MRKKWMVMKKKKRLLYHSLGLKGFIVPLLAVVQLSYKCSSEFMLYKVTCSLTTDSMQ